MALSTVTKPSEPSSVLHIEWCGGYNERERERENW